MLQGAGEGVVETIVPPQRSVTIVGGRPILNDAALRFDKSVATPHARVPPASGALRVRNERMQGEPLRALVDFGCDVALLAVDGALGAVFVRDAVVLGWDDGVRVQPQTGGYGRFDGVGLIVVRRGRQLGSLDVDGRTVQMAVGALRAYQGRLHFETEACGALYRISGPGRVWWGVEP